MKLANVCIGSDGKVLLSDEELQELERTATFAPSAGGVGETNSVCGDTGDRNWNCTNTVNCSKSKNTGCTNERTCYEETEEPPL